MISERILTYETHITAAAGSKPDMFQFKIIMIKLIRCSKK